jgi:hypothetical protein
MPSFNSLWQMSEKESAEIREIDSRTITNLVDASLMMEEEGQKELHERGVVLNELKAFEPPEDEPLEFDLPPLPGEEGAGIQPGTEQ